MDKSQPRSSLIVEDLPTLTSDRGVESEASVFAAPLRTQIGGENWGDAISPRARKSNRVRAILTYTGVGLVSFLVFLYLSFPFNVVKEVAVSRVNEALIQQRIPLRISVGAMKPKFPVGIQLEDVQLMNVNDSLANLKIGRASATLNVLPILTGKLDADVRFTQSGGSFDVNVSDKIASLIKLASSPNARMPSGSLNVSVNNFDISPVVANALSFVKTSDNPMVLTIKPFLNTEIRGTMSGKVSVDMPEPGASFEKLMANVDLKLNQAYFEMRDDTLGIPRQEFTDARIKLKLAQKTLEIPVETKLVANDLGIELSGRMNILDNMSINDLSLKLGLTMRGKIEENFKNIILLSVLKCDVNKFVNGRIDVELTGIPQAMNCN